MRLQRAERDYYVVAIATEPPITGTWQASFDAGTTWHDGDLGAQGWAWLVAGPDFDATSLTPPMDPADTVATIVADVRPLLRIAEDPVLDIEPDAPRITLV